MGPRGYFMHRRFGNCPKGGVTAYFMVELLPENRYLISYSLARCNPIDNFEKRRNCGDVTTYMVEAPDPEAARGIVIRRMEKVCLGELDAMRDLHALRIGELMRKYTQLIREGIITI